MESWAANNPLAALMITDQAGNTLLFDEHQETVRRLLPLYGGQEVRVTGERTYVEFGSAIAAVECAAEIQSKLHERGQNQPADRQARVRLGIRLSESSANDEREADFSEKLESSAAPGGVCLTQQVYELVVEKFRLPIRSVEGSPLFQVVLPWNGKGAWHASRVLRVWGNWQARFRRTSMNSMVVGSLFAVCLGLMFFTADATWKASSRSSREAGRAPASLFAGGASPAAGTSPRREGLNDGWSYAPDSLRRSPDGIPSPPLEGWKDFDPMNPWRFADEIQGSYWLRKTFEIRYPFELPAIVLGLVPDTHRVYLNGQFVGGTDRAGDLAFYPLEPNAVHWGEPNTLLISARTRPSLSPGLRIQPRIGAFMGEFEDVRRTVMGEEIRTHVLHGIYLALSLAAFVAGLGLALYQGSRRHYIYGSFYLMLGVIHFCYYNPSVSSTLDFQFLLLLKATALALAPFILHSAYLHLRRRYLVESVNNGLALALFVGTAVALFRGHDLPSGRMRAFDMTVAIGGIYAACWVAFAFFETAGEWIRLLVEPMSASKNRVSASPTFELVAIAFGGASVLSLAVAFRGMQVSHFVSPAFQYTIRDWTLALPFVFSAFVLVTALLDHRAQNHVIARKKSRDQLVLGLIRVIHDSPNITEVVVTIQERVCRFLKARRSTLYVLETSGAGNLEGPAGEPTLKASYVVGDDEVRREVKRILRPDTGLIGYACVNRAPLLIRDLHTDMRFAGEEKSLLSSYKTGTCMIFPLISGSRLLGVLTFADKEGDVEFTHDDFAMALEVSTDVALLLDNRQLQDSLQKNVEASS